MFCRKGVLKDFAKFIGKHLCQSLFFNKVTGLSNFIEKETLAQVFFYGFCEFLRTFFFNRTTPVAASGLSFLVCQELCLGELVFHTALRSSYAAFYSALSFTLPMFLIIKLLFEARWKKPKSRKRCKYHKLKEKTKVICLCIAFIQLNISLMDIVLKCYSK